MDVHVPYAVTLRLRLVGVSVITAQEDGYAEADDDVLLERATSLDCTLVSQDDDLLAEAKYRLVHGIPFGRVIYRHQQRVNIGVMVRDLELMNKYLIRPQQLLPSSLSEKGCWSSFRPRRAIYQIVLHLLAETMTTPDLSVNQVIDLNSLSFISNLSNLGFA